MFYKASILHNNIRQNKRLQICRNVSFKNLYGFYSWQISQPRRSIKKSNNYYSPFVFFAATTSISLAGAAIFPQTSAREVNQALLTEHRADVSKSNVDAIDMRDAREKFSNILC